MAQKFSITGKEPKKLCLTGLSKELESQYLKLTLKNTNKFQMLEEFPLFIMVISPQPKEPQFLVSMLLLMTLTV
jgi:hypothetical protein